MAGNVKGSFGRKGGVLWCLARRVLMLAELLKADTFRVSMLRFLYSPESELGTDIEHIADDARRARV